jgi:uncharacterized protein (DUF58 family)
MGGWRVVRVGWERFWSWRRITFSRGGIFFSAGAFAVGFAAINTGNNLLYLLLGAMLGFIAISSWLSEQVIGGVRVIRYTPRGVTVGAPVRIRYLVHSHRRRIPGFSIEIGEEGLPGQAFIPFLQAGESTEARSENRFVQRGIFPLKAITVATSFPFGLFRKSLSLSAPGELIIWPRTDRKVGMPLVGGGPDSSGGTLALASPGLRGEYRGLRGYRPGDDPRDIHWRSTARLGTPVVREYEESRGQTLWVCLDGRGEAGGEAEVAVELVASMAARAFHEGRRFGFSGPGVVVEEGQGSGQLERVLDALARVDFRPDHPHPRPPVPIGRCVLVSPFLSSRGGWGALVTPPRQRHRRDGGGE